MSREESKTLKHILRDLEENHRLVKKIEVELSHVAHVVRKIEKELLPQPLTVSVANVFTGDLPMPNNVLVFTVSQTSTDTITPLLADGVTPSDGVVSNLRVAFSDDSATAVVNGTNTILFTAVAPSIGPIAGTTICTVTDSDGAVSEWNQIFTVTTNPVVPPIQLTQSVANVFSTPA